MNRTFGILDRMGNGFHLEILDHGLFHGDSSWRFDAMRSPFNRLYFVLGGGGSVGGPGGTVDLRPGYCALIPFGSTNDYRCPSAIVKFYVHFRIDLHYGSDLFDGILRPMDEAFDQPRVEALLSSLEADSGTAVLRLHALLLETVAGFLDRLPTATQERFTQLAHYNGLAAFVRNRPSARLTLQDLALYSGRPLKSLSREYQRDTGTSLRSLLTRNLLQSAQERLLLSDRTVRQIALDLEFCDEFYFSRFFRRHAGLPPSEYRRRFRMVSKE